MHYIIWKQQLDSSNSKTYYQRSVYQIDLLFYRFVLNTDVNAVAVREFLQQFYSKVWVEYVVKNPLWTPGTPVTSDLFKQKTDQFIRQSALFSMKPI